VNGIANAMQKFPGLFDASASRRIAPAQSLTAQARGSRTFKPDLGDPFPPSEYPAARLPLFMFGSTYRMSPHCFKLRLFALPHSRK